jgi:hypothetical protein
VQIDEFKSAYTKVRAAGAFLAHRYKMLLSKHSPHDAFGANRTSFWELHWKMPIFHGREAWETPNVS